MKKTNFLYGLILSAAVILAGCNQIETEPPLFPDEANTVELTYTNAAETTTRELEQDEIADIKEWAAALELEHKTFEDGNSPGDAEGGDAFDFDINNGEVSFSYINSDVSYILSGEEWYEVKNPSDPPVENPAETEAPPDIIPMVMVDGKLYYDTGKESSLNRRCGTMDGKITSAVGRSETPAEDNQSNFGVGFGYQFGYAGSIEVFINEKWVVFEHRNGTGGQIRFGDRWVDEADLSEKTIAWLTWYNSLPAEEQLAVSYVPSDLLEASGLVTIEDSKANEKTAQVK